jgi:hypothetical protein
MFRIVASLSFIMMLGNPMIHGNRVLTPEAPRSAPVLADVFAWGFSLTPPVTVHPAGHIQVYYNDPECPGNPDSYRAWIIYVYESGAEAYRVFGGHTTYWCGSVYKPSTMWFYENPSNWTECDNYWYGPVTCPYLGGSYP